MNIDIVQIAISGFAAVVAWRLLGYLLNTQTRKMDCMKDTLIEVVKRLDRIETKLGG